MDYPARPDESKRIDERRFTGDRNTAMGELGDEHESVADASTATAAAAEHARSMRAQYEADAARFVASERWIALGYPYSFSGQ